MNLNQFLIQAKLHTCVRISEGSESVQEDGRHELGYNQDEFRYRDYSSGINPFIGEVQVWQADRLVWAMNYYGKADGDIVPVNQINRFLQQALPLARPNRPFRGPDFFRAGPFTYIDKSEGRLEAFTGEEVIYFRDQQVYHLIYHGGRIAS